MHQPKRWIIAPASPAAELLAASLKTSPVIAQILINRGVVDQIEAGRFLTPSLKFLHEPQTIANLSKAAERIAQAIHAGEKIVIYGDYDVDGITATSILWHAIRILGGQADFYIPHRLEEGYGLNSDAIAQICDQGARLILTVDCGVTAIEQAEVAAARGVDLIVTDHHDWREAPGEDGVRRPVLPRCYAIVHPRLGPDGGPSDYPNPDLCGAGVAFKLAWGLGQAHGGATRVSEEFRHFLVEATALAALGTIADVVPLVGENRLLAHFGLGGLKRSELTGIRALIESASLTGQKLDSYHVGFLLAPRLNACGRMGHAREAVEMLTQADGARAREIAAMLEQQNRSRQALERKILDQAMEQARELGFDRPDQRAIVLGGEDWHPGVIGIVASRVVNRLHRPAVMVALSDGQGHGSARSIPGFHLAKALDACREHLEACGGHEMAAGLRVRPEKFEDFRRAFCDYARGVMTDQMLIPQIRLDCVTSLRQITAPLVVDLQRLGPFGTANPRPILCCPDVEIAADPRRVGRNGEHLQISVRQENVLMKCVAFNMAGLIEQLRPGVRVDLAAEPNINEFNGRRNVELELKDVRIC